MITLKQDVKQSRGTGKGYILYPKSEYGLSATASCINPLQKTMELELFITPKDDPSKAVIKFPYVQSISVNAEGETVVTNQAELDKFEADYIAASSAVTTAIEKVRQATAESESAKTDAQKEEAKKLVDTSTAELKKATATVTKLDGSPVVAKTESKNTFDDLVATFKGVVPDEAAVVALFAERNPVLSDFIETTTKK